MIFDLHNDFLTCKLTDSEKESHLDDLNNAVGCIFAYFSTRMDGLPVSVDLPKNVYFAVEDLHFYKKEMLFALLSLKPKYCSLTWNYDNALGGGALGYSGLTPFGKETAKTLEKNGVLLDGAHLNERSFYDLCDVVNEVIVSHTNVYDIKPHPRNLKKEQIKLIKEKNGIVGLTPLVTFCGDTLDCFVSAIDYVVELAGEDTPVIGSDFNGSTNFPSWLENGYCGFEELQYALENKGYKKSTIDKIFFENAKRRLGLKY